MKHKSERYQSRRITPWDGLIEKTPTQEFVTKVTMEHYNQRYPELSETGEVELINSFVPINAHIADFNHLSETVRPK